MAAEKLWAWFSCSLWDIWCWFRRPKAERGLPSGCRFCVTAAAPWWVTWVVYSISDLTCFCCLLTDLLKWESAYRLTRFCLSGSCIDLYMSARTCSVWSVVLKAVQLTKHNSVLQAELNKFPWLHALDLHWLEWSWDTQLTCGRLYLRHVYISNWIWSWNSL